MKSASYPLHGNRFVAVRNFLLEHSARILQDNSGIPVSYFENDKWHLRAFGRYGLAGLREYRL